MQNHLLRSSLTQVQSPTHWRLSHTTAPSQAPLHCSLSAWGRKTHPLERSRDCKPATWQQVRQRVRAVSRKQEERTYGFAGI